ncbi:hypothetical protein B0T14DRAFT_531565 [Immersiella caudata]|uniref:Uncharacterized protein n=1 Tax=Immersiella caudata TaxID=314043 RepID=A0AA39TLV8_9PEZI|nr:hypothetical protein B0T14DRAFT_531565 [Immersiella caudata]
MDLQASRPVPLPPSLRKRFYEPVIMLYCLTAAYVNGQIAESAGSEAALPSSRKQIYFCFVNKLAHICDSRKGGKTVTSFAVLQPGSIEYRFGSNSRRPSELTKVRNYITGILTTLGEASSDDIKKATKDSKQPIFCQILAKITLFNRPRIEYYARTLAKQVDFCIDGLEDDDSDEACSSLSNLQTLKQLASFALRPAEPEEEEDDSDSPALTRIPEDEYVDLVDSLVRTIDEFRADGLEEFIRDKCQGDREGPATTHWSDVHHALGRLLSYFFAVKVLISARKLWPELFADFTVVSIPSSRPDRKSPDIRKSASKIISRMTNKSDILNEYRRNADDLQRWGLDEKIVEVTDPDAFKPIVHAEVLLDDALRREDRRNLATGEERVRFYRESEFGRYISSSKPTCRLCALYFEAHPDRVQVRPSHHNLYYNWRAPDVFASDDEAAEAQRNAVLQRMTTILRDETFAAIRNRSATHRPFDSNNTPSNVPLLMSTDRSSSTADAGDLVSVMGSLSIR